MRYTSCAESPSGKTPAKNHHTQADPFKERRLQPRPGGPTGPITLRLPHRTGIQYAESNLNTEQYKRYFDTMAAPGSSQFGTRLWATHTTAPVHNKHILKIEYTSSSLPCSSHPYFAHRKRRVTARPYVSTSPSDIRTVPARTSLLLPDSPVAAGVRIDTMGHVTHIIRQF